MNKDYKCTPNKAEVNSARTETKPFKNDAIRGIEELLHEPY